MARIDDFLTYSDRKSLGKEVMDTIKQLVNQMLADAEQHGPPQQVREAMLYSQAQGGAGANATPEDYMASLGSYSRATGAAAKYAQRNALTREIEAALRDLPQNPDEITDQIRQSFVDKIKGVYEELAELNPENLSQDSPLFDVVGQAEADVDLIKRKLNEDKAERDRLMDEFLQGTTAIISEGLGQHMLAVKDEFQKQLIAKMSDEDIQEELQRYMPEDMFAKFGDEMGRANTQQARGMAEQTLMGVYNMASEQLPQQYRQRDLQYRQNLSSVRGMEERALVEEAYRLQGQGNLPRTDILPNEPQQFEPSKENIQGLQELVAEARLHEQSGGTFLDQATAAFAGAGVANAMSGGGGGRRGGGRQAPPGGPEDGPGGGPGGPFGGGPGGVFGPGQNFARDFGAMNIATDIATPGGRSFVGGAAGTISNLAGAAAPWLATMGPLGIMAAGTATLGARGVGMYTDFASQQRGLESIIGEHMGYMPQDFIGQFAKGGTIPGEQLRARVSNPFMSGEEVEQLTEAIANLGASAEETAHMIGPAADIVNDYRTSIEGTTRAMRAGMLSSPLGARFGEYYAQTAHGISGRGMTMPEVEAAMQQGQQQFQGYFGPARGMEIGAQAAGMISGGTEEQTRILAESGTPERIMQLMEQTVQDPATATMLGTFGGPGVETPEGQRQFGAGLTQAIQMATAGLQRDENGKIARNPINDMNIQAQIQGNPALRGLTVQDIYNYGDQLTANPQALTGMIEERIEDREAADTAFIGMTGVDPNTGEVQDVTTTPEEAFTAASEGTDSILDKGHATLGSSSVPTWVPDEEGTMIATASADQQLWGSTPWDLAEAASGVEGAEPLSFLATQTAEGQGTMGISPGDISTETGEYGDTLADLIETEGGIEALAAGEEKLAVEGGEQDYMAASEIAQAIHAGRAQVAEGGTFSFDLQEEGQEGKSVNAGGVQITLSDEASRHFNVKSVEDPSTTSGGTVKALNDYFSNEGTSNMNEAPVHG